MPQIIEDRSGIISVIASKKGADAFIAERKLKLQAVIPKIIKTSPNKKRITMDELLAIELLKAERNPELVVTREIAKLEKAEIEAENMGSYEDATPMEILE